MQTYTVSLYWSVMTFTTIGYGDIVPFTNIERIFDIVAMLIGALVFGYIIGAVGNVVQQVRQTDAFCGERPCCVGDEGLFGLSSRRQTGYGLISDGFAWWLMACYYRRR
jgi:hypothetical protein